MINDYIKLILSIIMGIITLLIAFKVSASELDCKCDRSVNHTVYIRYVKFTPDKLVIKQNDRVIFTNLTWGTHVIQFKDLKLKSDKLRRFASYTIQFTKPGTYNYNCLTHKSGNVRGTIIVESK